MFGGSSSVISEETDRIFRFNASSLEAEQLGTIPLATLGAAGVWDSEKEVAYVFGGLPDSTLAVWRYHPPTNSIVELSPYLPVNLAHASAAFFEGDGRVYLVGGHSEQGNAILRFDPSTNRTEALQVDGWPEIGRAHV